MYRNEGSKWSATARMAAARLADSIGSRGVAGWVDMLLELWALWRGMSLGVFDLWYGRPVVVGRQEWKRKRRRMDRLEGLGRNL